MKNQDGQLNLLDNGKQLRRKYSIFFFMSKHCVSKLIFYREKKFVDLQLPELTHEYVYVPAANVPYEPPQKTFKEKTVTLNEGVATDVPSSFKKRKNAVKRNARQRLDDD